MDNDMKKDVQTKLKMFGYSIPEENSAEIWNMIDLSYRTTVQYHKNFCNILEIPNGLYFSVVNMTVADFLFQMVASGQVSSDIGLKPLSSISEGDVSYTYAFSSEDDNISYNKAINAYREARFTDLEPYKKLPSLWRNRQNAR